MSDNPERAFWAWRQRSPRLAHGVTAETFAEVYRMGGRHALRASSDLAELVPKLRELIWWFEAEGDLDVEPEGEYAR